jgi:2-polyprenyl-3-methyl-5-hydroxy-6-metoxy-1,4-benzoquinol methylase
MLDGNWQKDYPHFLETGKVNLDEHQSLQKIIDLVGLKKNVVDFGCASGYLAEFLLEKDCSVTGIDINEKAAKLAQNYCRRVIVADLDHQPLSHLFNEEQLFDVAVFGDVLEHLRNPWTILRETLGLLNSQGYVIASIPNIAHGAIRLALLAGNFDYQQMGILDNTHLRFFTYKSVIELFETSGYTIESIDRTLLSMFSNSSLLPSLDWDSIDPTLLKKLQTDREIDTLQFIIKARPK